MRYTHHIFICTNVRSTGDARGCCSAKGSEAIRKKFKDEIKSRGLKSEIRVNNSGCLDACEFGATIVIYPEGTWYGNVQITDVDEIIERHLIGGTIVERLLIKTKSYLPPDKLHLLSDNKV